MPGEHLFVDGDRVADVRFMSDIGSPARGLMFRADALDWGREVCVFDFDPSPNPWIIPDPPEHKARVIHALGVGRPIRVLFVGGGTVGGVADLERPPLAAMEPCDMVVEGDPGLLADVEAGDDVAIRRQEEVAADA